MEEKPKTMRDILEHLKGMGIDKVVFHETNGNETVEAIDIDKSLESNTIVKEELRNEDD